MSIPPSSGNEPECDRQRRQHEHHEDEAADASGQHHHELAGARPDPSQRLERRPEPVGDVQAHEADEHQVDDHHQGLLERGDHAVIGRGVRGEAGAHRAGGEVEDVEDDQEEQQDTADAHRARGVGVGGRLLDDVAAGACAPGALPGHGRGPHVDDQHEDHREAEDPDKDIHLYINSPGGVVTAGMAIYDTMQYIKPDVSTICVGSAASMGSVLLAAGVKGKRYALPHSRVMIHQPLGGVQGQATEIEIHAKEILRMKSELNGILAYHTGKSLDTIQHDTDRDYFLTATEAKAYGLVDEILERPVVEKDKA